MTCPLYASVHVYTVQVTFNKAPKNTLPCLAGHPVGKDVIKLTVTVLMVFRFQIRRGKEVEDKRSVAGKGKDMKGKDVKQECIKFLPPPF